MSDATRTQGDEYGIDGYPEGEVRAALAAIFGDDASLDPPPPPPRGVRLKISPSGRLSPTHPMADGPHIIKVQQVPANVSMADVCRRMQSVCVLRRDRTLHYSEIRAGAILR